MNRRGFMKIVAGVLAIPAIGLPVPVKAAPVLKLWPFQEQMLSAMRRAAEETVFKPPGFATFKGVKFFYTTKLSTVRALESIVRNEKAP